MLHGRFVPLLRQDRMQMHGGEMMFVPYITIALSAIIFTMAYTDGTFRVLWAIALISATLLFDWLYHLSFNSRRGNK